MKHRKRERSNITKLDRVGRVLIPKQIREQAKICIEEPVEFVVKPDAIGVRPYHKTCSFCHTEKDIEHFENIYICPACRQELLRSNEQWDTEKEELKTG